MSEVFPLAKLRLDGGTQSRAQIDQPTVEAYAEDIRHGAIFPPVVVFYDGVDYWLADGFHRAKAYEFEECISVPATVRSGTRREAVLYSVGANGSHGLRRTNADKKRAVETLLADEEWSKKSDRWIAEKCGVSHTTVQSVRHVLDSTGKDCQLSERAGQDGKTRRLPKRHLCDVRAEESVSEVPARSTPVLPAVDLRPAVPRQRSAPPVPMPVEAPAPPAVVPDPVTQTMSASTTVTSDAWDELWVDDTIKAVLRAPLPVVEALHRRIANAFAARDLYFGGTS